MGLYALYLLGAVGRTARSGPKTGADAKRSSAPIFRPILRYPYFFFALFRNSGVAHPQWDPRPPLGGWVETNYVGVVSSNADRPPTPYIQRYF